MRYYGIYYTYNQVEYPKQVYEGSAQEGLDKFFAYINGDEHAFD